VAVPDTAGGPEAGALKTADAAGWLAGIRLISAGELPI